MSDELDSLARQILEKTSAGKLLWTLVPNSTSEEFRADIGDQQFIAVKRTSQGDNKQIELLLSNEAGVILEGRADNVFTAATASILSNIGVNVPQSPITDLLMSTVNPDFQRFNLLSDVFLAARRVATGQDSALAKFKSSLQNVGD